MNVLKLRRASIYALILSIINNLMGWVLNLIVLSYLGLSLLGVYIFISIFFWRCPFCKKRLHLVNDTKYTEYAEYINYLWIAIPTELLEVAKDNVPGVVGILCYKDNKIVIEREAERLNPLKLIESLTIFSLRVM